MILIDSDVLIWDTRGHSGVKTRLAQINRWRISAITYMELAQGCRDNTELQRLKRGFATHQTEIRNHANHCGDLAARYDPD